MEITPSSEMPVHIRITRRYLPENGTITSTVRASNPKYYDINDINSLERDADEYCTENCSETATPSHIAHDALYLY